MFGGEFYSDFVLMIVYCSLCISSRSLAGGIVWRTSASHSSASGHTGRSNGQTEVAAHACASMCDEMVVLWDGSARPYHESPEVSKLVELVRL